VLLSLERATEHEVLHESETNMYLLGRGFLALVEMVVHRLHHLERLVTNEDELSLGSSKASSISTDDDYEGNGGTERLIRARQDVVIYSVRNSRGFKVASHLVDLAVAAVQELVELGLEAAERSLTKGGGDATRLVGKKRVACKVVFGLWLQFTQQGKRERPFQQHEESMSLLTTQRAATTLDNDLFHFEARTTAIIPEEETNHFQHGNHFQLPQSQSYLPQSHSYEERADQPRRVVPQEQARRVETKPSANLRGGRAHFAATRSKPKVNARELDKRALAFKLARVREADRASLCPPLSAPGALSNTALPEYTTRLCPEKQLRPWTDITETQLRLKTSPQPSASWSRAVTTRPKTAQVRTTSGGASRKWKANECLLRAVEYHAVDNLVQQQRKLTTPI
jgi:hypothetical protein